MGWAEYIAAFIVFFVVHSVPVRKPIRSRLVSAMGERGFFWVYSLASLAVLYWLILAAGRAPHIELWEHKKWQNHVTIVSMVVALEIVALSINKPNPFSFGGNTKRAFNPRRAGLVQWTRHPYLTAGFFWSTAHIFPNGDLAHLLMFGAFSVFAVMGVKLIDQRKQQEMGMRKWQATLNEVVQNRRDLLGMNPQSAINRLVVGMICYGVLVWSHSYLFGFIRFEY